MRPNNCNPKVLTIIEKQLQINNSFNKEDKRDRHDEHILSKEMTTNGRKLFWLTWEKHNQKNIN